MAIIESLGLEVTVRIDEQALTEYNDPEPDSERQWARQKGKVTLVDKYIESQEDSEYDISLKVSHEQMWLAESRTNLLCFYIYIDGKDIDHRLVLSHWLKDSKDGYTTDVLGQVSTVSGVSKLHKFRFGTITTTDEFNSATVEEEIKRAKSLGIIRVEVWPHVLLNKNPSTLSSGTSKPKDTKLSIAEKALKGKGVSHGTNFSPAEDFGGYIYYDTKKKGSKPLAVFYFKYRSKEALRDEMIVARTPSPSPSQVVNELDHDELLRLARERLVELRTKRDQDDQYIKTESPSKSRGPKRRVVEAFDLTGDDEVMVSMEPPTKKARPSDGQEAISLDD